MVSDVEDVRDIARDVVNVGTGAPTDVVNRAYREKLPDLTSDLRYAIENDPALYLEKLKANLDAGVPVKVGYRYAKTDAAGNILMDAGNVVTGGHAIIGLRIIDDPVQGLLLRHFDPAYGKVFDKPLAEYTSRSVQQGKQFTPVVEVIHPENSIERAFIRVESGIQADADAISMWALSDTTDTIRLMEQAGLLMMDFDHTPDELTKITIELLHAEGYRRNIYIRPLAFKADESIGVKLHGLRDELSIVAVPFERYVSNDTNAHVTFSSWRRVDDNMIPARGKISGS